MVDGYTADVDQEKTASWDLLFLVHKTFVATRKLCILFCKFSKAKTNESVMGRSSVWSPSPDTNIPMKQVASTAPSQRYDFLKKFHIPAILLSSN